MVSLLAAMNERGRSVADGLGLYLGDGVTRVVGVRCLRSGLLERALLELIRRRAADSEQGSAIEGGDLNVASGVVAPA